MPSTLKSKMDGRVPKPQSRWKMFLYLVIIMLFSWALYLAVIKFRASDIMHEASSNKNLDENSETEQSIPASSSDRIRILDLPAKHIPKTGNHGESVRLIIVGDVHGMLHELNALLDKVQFNEQRDHLILAGDMIAKGPDSLGVVDLAIKLGASAVRGNHEHRIIVAHTAMSVNNGLFKVPPPGDEFQRGKYYSDGGTSSHRDSKDRALATLLGEERLQWLQNCPIILRIGRLGDMGEVVVVHAGLEPGVKLQEQDSYMAMNMRTISKNGQPTDGHLGEAWIKVCNFIYGHLFQISNVSRLGMIIKRISREMKE